MRRMPRLLSELSSTLCFDSGCQKLGQPVPDSNLVRESNSAVWQHTQPYSPSACWFHNAPENARSVPARRVTSNASAESCWRHCASLRTTLGSCITPRLWPAGEKPSIDTVPASADSAARALPSSVRAATTPIDATAQTIIRRRIKSVCSLRGLWDAGRHADMADYPFGHRGRIQGLTRLTSRNPSPRLQRSRKSAIIHMLAAVRGVHARCDGYTLRCEHEQTPAAALHAGERRREGASGGRRLEYARPRSRRAGLYRRHTLAQPGRISSRARTGARVPAAQVGTGTRLPPDQAALGLRWKPHCGALRLRMA